jgi:hypothetical protein
MHRHAGLERDNGELRFVDFINIPSLFWRKKKLVAGDIVNLHCSGSEGMTAGGSNSISDSFPEAPYKRQFKGTTPARTYLYFICCYVPIKYNCYSFHINTEDLPWAVDCELKLSENWSSLKSARVPVDVHKIPQTHCSMGENTIKHRTFTR